MKKHAPEPTDAPANDDWAARILEVGIALARTRTPVARDVASVLGALWFAREDAVLIADYARAIQRARARRERQRAEDAIIAEERALPPNVIGVYSWLRAHRRGGRHAS